MMRAGVYYFPSFAFFFCFFSFLLVFLACGWFVVDYIDHIDYYSFFCFLAGMFLVDVFGGCFFSWWMFLFGVAWLGLMLDAWLNGWLVDWLVEWWMVEWWMPGRLVEWMVD
ncbi:hypothetical protein BZA77DRAFT_327976 [Pyronema omphalodes]|nr:hypothetical protein BZA77DRAFT_327976 [Pyronema omphalodes]